MDSKIQRIRMVLGTIAAAVVASQIAHADYVPGEVIVKYKPGTLALRSTMLSTYQDLGVFKVKRIDSVGSRQAGFEHLIFSKDTSVEKAVQMLSQNPMVEYAQPNYIMRIKPIETAQAVKAPHPMEPCWIPGFPFPPGCDDSGTPGNPGQPGNPGNRPPVQDAPALTAGSDPDVGQTYGMKMIGATDAWKVHQGNSKMVVAVIDTGIDYNHEDLSYNVWRNPNPSSKNDVVGYNVVTDDGLPFDDHSHGTHCAGVIGAVGENSKAISGVNQRVSVMGVKFLTGQGQGTTTDAIKAIDYAVNNGAKVLSNSWGGDADQNNNLLEDAIKRAEAKDVLFIAAAGNDSRDNDTNPSYPAAFTTPNMITVAATDQNDRMAYFSNYGKTGVHLGAPGVGIYSTTPNNTYKRMDGTSMACPHVAGAAALVWSKNPSLKYSQVKDILLKSVDSISALQGKTTTGGRLNVLKALRSME